MHLLISYHFPILEYYTNKTQKMALSDTLQELIQAGVQVAAYSTSVANSGASTADTLKNQLYANATKIQSLINNILEKGGVVTQDEVNALDEQIRISKLKALQAEAKMSTNKYAIYVVAGLAVVGIIWYYTYKKT
jgi:hypothetical protein